MPDAFRRMATGLHTGKIVVLADRDTAPVLPHQTARPDDWGRGSYLVTGGTGGLGLEAARWMADEGARHIVLVGRRGETPELSASLRPLRDRGVNVFALAGDMAIASDVERVMSFVDENCPPLAGIIHAAGILDDATIPQMSADHVARAFAPKVSGAWNLHRATLARPLDFFVLYSSVTSFIGSAGRATTPRRTRSWMPLPPIAARRACRR